MQLQFTTSRDKHGHIGAIPYDQTILNGQWSAFLHVHTSGAAVGSEATLCILYDSTVRYALCWMVPWNAADPTVYIGPRGKDSTSGNFKWKEVWDNTDGNNSSNGCTQVASRVGNIGNSTSPFCVFVLSTD